MTESIVAADIAMMQEVVAVVQVAQEVVETEPMVAAVAYLLVEQEQ